MLWSSSWLSAGLNGISSVAYLYTAALATAFEVLPFIWLPAPGTAVMFGNTFETKILFGKTASTVALKGLLERVIPLPVT